MAPEQLATQRQLRFLSAVAREAGLDESALALLSFERFESEPERLSRRDAAALIDYIQTAHRKGAKL